MIFSLPINYIKSIYDLIGLNPKTNEPIAGGGGGGGVNNGGAGSTSLNSINLKVKDNTSVKNGAADNNSKQDDNSNKGSNDNLVVENPTVRTDQIFQKMDLDKNGVISEAEFINGCLQDKFLYQMLTADYSESF